jgi:uncharacterized protein YkwD
MTPAPAGAAEGSSAASDPAVEHQVSFLLNPTRASLGRAALSVGPGLRAQAQAQSMATAGSLSHSNVAALLGSWSSVGENVGVGTTAGDVHNALLGSPAHYQNLASSGFSAVGVGAVVDGAGRRWVAEVFAA